MREESFRELREKRVAEGQRKSVCVCEREREREREEINIIWV